ncbi:MAG TPA: HlyD family secretion protein [Tepidisphaeraceae bacterium]|nr:HlyD family secretion protein [Tepidisphaeraceae bacterium]
MSSLDPVMSAENAATVPPNALNGNGSPAPEPPAQRAGRPIYRRRRFYIVLATVLIALIAGSIYWYVTYGYEDTDDAFIAGNVVPISNKVAGTVEQVFVRDNQDVAAGTLLVKIDPQDIQAQLDHALAEEAAAKSRLEVAKTNVDLTQANTSAALAQANAGVTQAQAGVASAEAQMASAQADVAAAKAEAVRRNSDLKRYLAADRRGVSQQQIDAARAAADAANAQLAAAQKRVTGAESAVSEAKAKVLAAQANQTAAQTGPQQVSQAKAEVQTAEAAVKQTAAAVQTLQLQLSYTSIYSPVAGRVTKKIVQVGQNLQIGSSLMALVEPDVWVIANFKETQLTHMRAGQPVTVKVDAYPGKVFQAKVQSIAAGTGAEFSLLPPENATGNYVKVVQRIPVKIVFDNTAEARELLALGMSVVPTVHVGGDGVAPEPITSPTTQPAEASAQ